MENKQPNNLVEESQETKIQRLENENINLKQLLSEAMKENQILRATLKALSQLL